METKLTFTHVIPTALVEALEITEKTPVVAYIHNGTIYVEVAADDGLTEDDCPYMERQGCEACDCYRRRNRRCPLE